jgi:hypothetical protein
VVTVRKWTGRHKLICKTLKKLLHQLQPYQEVVRLIKEILNEDFKKAELKVTVLKQLVAYAEYQFGNQVPLRVYRERENGETIDNWTVEIKMLIHIYNDLANFYIGDESLGMIFSNNLRLPLYEMILDLLRPWSADLDSNSTGWIDSMTKDQMNGILLIPAVAEKSIAIIYLHRSQLNLVETHCQRGLSCARLYDGTEDEKTDLLRKALRRTSNVRRQLCWCINLRGGGYNCVTVAYNPVHPKVQSAASTLIECLTRKGDLCKVELFAQMTLDSLKDPKNGLDQQSEAVAKDFYDLASVIIEQRVDFVKAEKLVRDSLRIRIPINSNSVLVGNAIGLLAAILRMQDKLGSETKELFEQSLANSIRNYGPDGTNTAIDHINIGIYYCEVAKSQLPRREIWLVKGTFV